MEYGIVLILLWTCSTLNSNYLPDRNTTTQITQGKGQGQGLIDIIRRFMYYRGHVVRCEIPVAYVLLSMFGW